MCIDIDTVEPLASADAAQKQANSPRAQDGSPLRSVHRYIQHALRKWSTYPKLPHREDPQESMRSPLSTNSQVSHVNEINGEAPATQNKIEETAQDMADGTRPHTDFWEIATREGPLEVLYDYDREAVTFKEYGNVASFLAVTTPQVPLHPGAGPTDGILLSDIWAFYDDASGFEVPICTSKGDFAFSLYYTPLVSSVNIRLAGSAETMEYSCGAPPLERLPFAQQVQYLISNKVGSFERMDGLRTTDVDPESYYSVLWVPIHCQAHSPQKSAGVFLTYHSIHPSRLSCAYPAINRPISMLTESSLPQAAQVSELRRSAGTQASIYYCNCIGFIPFRVQSALWYRQISKRVFNAPLQLMRNAYTVAHLKTVTDTVDHDMSFYVSHDREMSAFLNRAVSG